MMFEHVLRHKESGLSISAYSQENGISYHSMHYWIKKYRRITATESFTDKEVFVELSTHPSSKSGNSNKSGSNPVAPPAQVELTFPSGLVLKIYE